MLPVLWNVLLWAGPLAGRGAGPEEEEAGMKIRPAEERDIAAITGIYNHAVSTTTAIWNDRVVDSANRAAWLKAHDEAGLPVLVAVDDGGGVAGYATFGPWRAWDGYRHTVEHSVYVHKDRQRAGIGRALMVALLEEARQRGYHAMVAGIESGNVGSIRLHEQLGFAVVGQCRQVGCKFGRWLDLTFMQILLDDRSSPG
ncbi:GCN5-related N-acetyltransferase [Parasaccharibacter apium]|uniref:GCN5-related N-acetyltransferase n=2 Tax=Parasaccharibacter apium TaxID=1510841 RepID=A0A7U7G3Y8_9PROT|nr:GCN5-related N-acetyltransferase [Parasaccharibacter apium]